MRWGKVLLAAGRWNSAITLLSANVKNAWNPSFSCRRPTSHDNSPMLRFYFLTIKRPGIHLWICHPINQENRKKPRSHQDLRLWSQGLADDQSRTWNRTWLKLQLSAVKLGVMLRIAILLAFCTCACTDPVACPPSVLHFLALSCCCN